MSMFVMTKENILTWVDSIAWTCNWDIKVLSLTHFNCGDKLNKWNKDKPISWSHAMKVDWLICLTHKLLIAFSGQGNVKILSINSPTWEIVCLYIHPTKIIRAILMTSSAEKLKLFVP
jgi:hypothetical protein